MASPQIGVVISGARGSSPSQFVFVLQMTFDRCDFILVCVILLRVGVQWAACPWFGGVSNWASSLWSIALCTKFQPRRTACSCLGSTNRWEHYCLIDRGWAVCHGHPCPLIMTIVDSGQLASPNFIIELGIPSPSKISLNR